MQLAARDPLEAGFERDPIEAVDPGAFGWVRDWDIRKDVASGFIEDGEEIRF